MFDVIAPRVSKAQARRFEARQIAPNELRGAGVNLILFSGDAI
jgi:hypothetical protein